MNKVVMMLGLFFLIISVQAMHQEKPKEVSQEKKSRFKSTYSQRKNQECICCGAETDCVLNFDVKK